jgi:hypothetical protein
MTSTSATPAVAARDPARRIASGWRRDLREKEEESFINILFAYIFWGEIGLTQLILNIFRSISSFSLLPVPLFLLMGEVMFLFGIAQNMMETMESGWGNCPGG